jgi:hypothetical protein
MQADTSRWTTGGQQLAEVIHMGPWLQFLRKLFQRDQGRRQSLRHHPFVMARDPLFWHQTTLPRDEFGGNLSR